MFRKIYNDIQFKLYQRKLIKVAKNSSSTIAHPILVFAALDLPAIYKKHGLGKAKQATDEFLLSITEKILTKFTYIACSLNARDLEYEYNKMAVSGATLDVLENQQDFINRWWEIAKENNEKNPPPIHIGAEF
jgi:hypothetical protein